MEEDTRPSDDSPTKERDTHFNGAAKTLLHTVFVKTEARNWREFTEQSEPIITQFLYDFAAYVIKENIGGMPSTVLLYVNETPDMTQWPERPKEERG